MSTKKKTTTKKTAKKTTAFDEALQLPAAKTVIAIEPMEVTADEQIDEGGEPWPNYSPLPEDEDTGPGFSPTNIQPATTNVDSVFDRLIAEAPKSPQKEDEPTLGSGSPVDASEPVSGTNIPSDAAKTVEDLIDGLNYLWKMAITIRGPRGPKQHDESILKKRVAAGRSLLASLK